MILRRAIAPGLVAAAVGLGVLFAACGTDDEAGSKANPPVMPGTPVKAIRIAGRAPRASNLKPAGGIPELRSRRERRRRASTPARRATPARERPSTPSADPPSTPAPRSAPSPAPAPRAAPEPRPAPPRPAPAPSPAPQPAPSGGGGSFDDSG